MLRIRFWGFDLDCRPSACILGPRLMESTKKRYERQWEVDGKILGVRV